MTIVRLLMTDRTVKKLVGILYGVLVHVKNFIFPANSVILDCEVNFDVLIILRSPFLATRRALVDLELGQFKFRLNHKEVIFNVFQSMKRPDDLKRLSL